MKSYMTEQEKCDLLMQVTVWAGLTVSVACVFYINSYAS